MNAKLRQGLKGHKILVFLDFEGTQFSHEMIAIGGLSCAIDVKTGLIKKRKNPFKIYVKAHNKIGGYVSELTGITEDTLKKNGVSFDTAMKELKKYVGINFKKATFITFGNHDMRILNQSIMYNIFYPKDVTSQIQKNYLDFSSLLNEYIRDDVGNALSLVHFCELFGVPEAGTAHDPEVDAINLANLYDAFVSNPNLVADEYLKHLRLHSGMYPNPIHKAVVDLASGKDVKASDFQEEVKKLFS